MSSAESGSHSFPSRWQIQDDEGNERRTYGELTIDESNNPSVRLYDPPAWIERAFLSGISGEPPLIPLIQGLTREHEWTLINSRIERHGWGRTELTEVALRPEFAACGDFVLDSEDLAVTSVLFRLWDHDVWTDWGESIKITDRNSARGTVASAVHESPESVTANVEGGTVTLCDISSGIVFREEDAVRLSARSAWKLSLEEPTDLRTLLRDWIKPFVYLTTSATRRKTGLSMMRIGSSQWIHPSTGEPWGKRLTLYAQNGSRPDSPLRWSDLRHRLEDWDLERQLPQLMRFARTHRSVADQYISHQNLFGRTWRSEFMALYPLVESLDRSLNPDPPMSEQQQSALTALDRALKRDDALAPCEGELRRSIEHQQSRNLARRLSQLDNQTGQFISRELGSKGWKNDLAALRNIVAHGLPAANELVSDRSPLWLGSQLLELLYEARSFVEMGFEGDDVERVIKASPHWEQRIAGIRKNLPRFAELVRSSQ